MKLGTDQFAVIFKPFYGIRGREVSSEFCNYLKEFRVILNPLTPVPPGTSHDVPWPLFCF